MERITHPRRQPTSGEADTSPVPEEHTAEFIDWLERGRDFDVVDVRLGTDVWVWFEDDAIFWERQSGWSSEDSATAPAPAPHRRTRLTAVDAKRQGDDP